jgi:hypothetical protein
LAIIEKLLGGMPYERSALAMLILVWIGRGTPIFTDIPKIKFIAPVVFVRQRLAPTAGDLLTERRYRL